MQRILCDFHGFQLYDQVVAIQLRLSFGSLDVYREEMSLQQEPKVQDYFANYRWKESIPQVVVSFQLAPLKSSVISSTLAFWHE